LLAFSPERTISSLSSRIRSLKAIFFSIFKKVHIMKNGDMWVVFSGGGGGYGDVLERDTVMVMDDLRKEVISRWTAENIYHVAYDPETLEVDEEKTKQLRQKEREDRKSRGMTWDASRRNGHSFVPPPVHAGGLRYHGMAPIVCHLYDLGIIDLRAPIKVRFTDWADEVTLERLGFESELRTVLAGRGMQTAGDVVRALVQNRPMLTQELGLSGRALDEIRGQAHVKRILAYSTIATLGLIVMCAGVGTNEAAWSALLLILFHAVAKSLLFLCVARGIQAREPGHRGHGLPDRPDAQGGCHVEHRAGRAAQDRRGEAGESAEVRADQHRADRQAHLQPRVRQSTASHPPRPRSR
jgi:hypothetical protein